MMQVDEEKFKEVGKLMVDCLKTATNLDGQKINVPSYGDEMVRHATLIGLMTLARDWLKPSSVKIMTKYGGF